MVVRLQNIMSTSESVIPADIDPEITVEDFLKQQCNEQIERLRNHAEQLIQQFQAESAEVREKLVERLEG